MRIFVFQELTKLHIPRAVKFFCKDAVPAVTEIDHQAPPKNAPATAPTTISAARTSISILTMRGFLSFMFIPPVVKELVRQLIFYHRPIKKSRAKPLNAQRKRCLCKLTKIIVRTYKNIRVY